nr:hypothetical protein [Tanacetum cinerariifolium]
AWLKGRLLEVTNVPESKELASPKQTALGKDKSNSLIVDSLLKTIWSSTHHVIAMKHWLFQSKRLLFWSTAKVKTVNDEVRVQALIDGKKVTIKESSILRTLMLDDEEGTSCLANNDIFTGLANMGYEKITMASTIICLATKQKFNFFRYILHSLVKNIEVGVPLYMFPRFVQLLVDHQLGDMSHHQDIYDNPSLTKKVFANMKRKQKSKKQQPIEPKVPSPTPSPEHQLPSPSTDPIPTAKDSLTLQELMDLCTRLSNKVLDLESEVIDIKSSFTDRIQKLEDRVDQLEEENRALKEKSFQTTQVDTAAPVENMEKSFKHRRMIADMAEDVEEAQAKAYNLDLQHAEKVVTNAQPTTTAAQVPKPSAPRRRKGFIIQDPEETTTSVIMHSKVQSKDKGKGILIEEPKPLKGKTHIDMNEAFTSQLEAELNANINWNDVIEQVKRSEKHDNAVMRYQALKRKHVNEAQGRKNMMIYLKNMAGFKMDFFKGMTYSEIRPIFEKHYNSIQDFLEKVEEERIDEEAEELKTHLQIVANDDDNVYTEATPLASKVPVVDYLIHHENNNPYYKIIRADGTHELFLSFITLLKKFDRDDLETLWRLVKERFKTTEPKNFSDDFLRNTLKIMSEKPNVKANMFLLVEKKYPLTRFTLQQMLDNVRLKVKKESEMSLELLRLVRRQLNEGPPWRRPRSILNSWRSIDEDRDGGGGKTCSDPLPPFNSISHLIPPYKSKDVLVNLHLLSTSCGTREDGWMSLGGAGKK